MKILIVGVSGFIGSHLYQALSQAGHEVIGCRRRRDSCAHGHYCDFNDKNFSWDPLLKDVDMVINAIGIYAETKHNSFYQAHVAGAKKLFDAVYRQPSDIKVIQISAMGADQSQPVSEFLASKRQADQYLLKLDISAIVFYPGMVLGEQGRSTLQLSCLASLWATPLVFGKNKRLPLMSIHQLTERVMQIVQQWPDNHKTEVLVAKPETMESLFHGLRQWLGLTQGVFLSVPVAIWHWVFRFFPKLSMGSFNRHSLTMLADFSQRQYPAIFSQSASESLGQFPASPAYAHYLRSQILLYINLTVLILIWVLSGVSSLVQFELSQALMAPLGLAPGLANAVIIIAAIADMLLGVLLIISRFRRRVIYAQIFVMIIYTLMVSIYLADFWLHPFGPITKNLAMFTLACYVLSYPKHLRFRY